MALENHHHRSYSTITNQILNVANILKESTANLTIQWVPSHVGLTGNEKADSLAKEAHNLVSETEAALDPKEMNNRLKSTCLERYQQQYDIIKEDLHIGTIKKKFIKWPWASSKCRRMETALARLRIGHSRLNAHLHRFGLTDDPNCSFCLTPATTKHLLEECLKYNTQRNSLYHSLHKLGILNPNTRILLGGGDYDAQIQNDIRQAVELFLRCSGSIELI